MSCWSKGTAWHNWDWQRVLRSGLAKHLLQGSLPSKKVHRLLRWDAQELPRGMRFFTYLHINVHAPVHQDPWCACVGSLAYRNIYSKSTQTSQIHLHTVTAELKCRLHCCAFAANFSRPWQWSQQSTASLSLRLLPSGSEHTKNKGQLSPDLCHGEGNDNMSRRLRHCGHSHVSPAMWSRSSGPKWAQKMNMNNVSLESEI